MQAHEDRTFPNLSLIAANGVTQPEEDGGVDEQEEKRTEGERGWTFRHAKVLRKRLVVAKPKFFHVEQLGQRLQVHRLRVDYGDSEEVAALLVLQEEVLAMRTRHVPRLQLSGVALSEHSRRSPLCGHTHSSPSRPGAGNCGTPLSFKSSSIVITGACFFVVNLTFNSASLANTASDIVRLLRLA
jgi:hypothetical protein